LTSQIPKSSGITGRNTHDFGIWDVKTIFEGSQTTDVEDRKVGLNHSGQPGRF
jgi:hypothetical protein